MYKYILTANYLVFFVLFSSESPCCDHECYEVRVVFDLCRDSGGVVVPLVSCNSSASAFLAKRGKKFNKNVMRCDISTEDFWMLGACEDLLEFFGVDSVFTEEVELGEYDLFVGGGCQASGSRTGSGTSSTGSRAGSGTWLRAAIALRRSFKCLMTRPSSVS